MQSILANTAALFFSGRQPTIDELVVDDMSLLSDDLFERMNSIIRSGYTAGRTNAERG
jgi:hypothetical protein